MAAKNSSKRKYSKSASKDVENAMRRRKKGTLRSGSGKKVKSKKQAIAIGLSEARSKGKKAPKKGGASRGGAQKRSSAERGSRKRSSISGALRQGPPGRTPWSRSRPALLH